MASFGIVKFPLEENCPRAVVPLTWLSADENTCYYPTSATYKQMDKFIRNQELPKEGWAACTAVVMRKYNNYSAARLDLPRSEMTSNLESDEDEGGNKQRRRVILSKRLKFPGESDSESVDDDIENKNLSRKVAGCTNKVMKFPALETFKKKCKVGTSSLLCEKSIADQANEDNLSIEIRETNQSSKSPQNDFLPCHSPASSSSKSSNVVSATSPATSVSSLHPQRPSVTNDFLPCHSPARSSSKSSNGVSATSPATSVSSFHPQRPSVTNEQIFQGILQIQATLASLHERVCLLEERGRNNPNVAMANSESDDAEREILAILPLNEINDFKALETKLSDTPILRKKFMKVMMAVGGRDVKSLTINIMRRVLSDSLATVFSYTGKKGFKEEKTEPFGKTEICQIIHTAVRKTYSEATNDIVKKLMMGYLNQAKTRIVRRQQEAGQQNIRVENDEEEL